MKQNPVLLTLATLVLAACNKSPTAGPDSPLPGTGASAVAAAQAPLPPVVPQRAQPVPPELAEGKRVFDKTCGLCHGAGTGGAPRPGDQANWAPRIAQGKAVLYQHAVQGFNGPQGYMPPRGGAALSDAEVQAGVDYLVAMSQ